MDKIKGVNLGNWLVLEKWMSPGLFDGTDAMDEFHLPQKLSREVYEARIHVHRCEYISERDFARIRGLGLNSVRIPVPYFIFGDCPPFIGCVEELDKAFSWAEKYGLKILIDLHTVPGSQNGFDNGGICGVCTWSSSPENVKFTLDLLEKLAVRYGLREGLLGITPVNEPATENIWRLMDVPNRYRAVETELARKSKPVAFSFLEKFYLDAYDRMRPNMADDKMIIFHDGFEPERWRLFFESHGLKGVMLDTHQYLMTAETQGCRQTKEGYLEWIREIYAPMIARVQKYVPVVCGEWCLFNSLAAGVDTKGGQSVLNGRENTAAQSRILSPGEKRELYLALAQAQTDAWKLGSGYYYWSYKVLLDTVNQPQWQGWDAWDFGKSCDEGWFSEQ